MTTNKNLRLATDPSTPADKLRQVASIVMPYHSDGRPVLEAVVANPNTPPDVLARLVTYYPDAFLKNPAVPLLLLESPGFFDPVPTEALKRMLRRPDVPVTLLMLLSEHREVTVAQAARMHVGIAGEAEPEGEGWEREAREAVAALPLGREVNLLELAGFGIVPPKVTVLLAGSRRVGVRTGAASLLPELRPLLANACGDPTLSRVLPGYAPDLSRQELRRLAEGGPWMRDLAARHPHTPPDVLDRLADDTDAFVRGRTAANPSTPAEALDRLYRRDEARYHILLASNPALPDVLLYALTADGNFRVRAAAARHPRLNAAALAELANDHTSAVRASVARNPSAPASLVARLADDTDASVRRAARHRAARPLPTRPFPRTANLVAPPGYLDDTPDTPRPLGRPLEGTAEDLLALAASDDPAANLRLARAPNAPPGALKRLAHRLRDGRASDVAILAAVAANPNTPADELQGLARNWREEVRRAAAQNPSLDEKSLRQLASEQGNFSVRQAALRHPRAAEWQVSRQARQAAIQSAREAAPSLLRLLGWTGAPLGMHGPGNLASSVEWLDRFALAVHPHTAPETVRDELTSDGNRIVRAAARARLANPGRVWIW